MKIEFHQKTFAIIGRFKTPRPQLNQKLKTLGAHISSTPRPSSTYIVIGKSPGKKLALVEKVGKPTLTEEELLVAIQAAETGREEGQEDLEISDAVVDLRALLYEEPSVDLWRQIQNKLDACGPLQQTLAVDYAEPHLTRWPDTEDQPGAPSPIGVASALRTFSPAWRNLALAGERAPKLRLGHHLSLDKMQLRGHDADHLTQHPDLGNLRSLDLGSTNQLDASFFQKLRLSEHLSNLSSLTLHHLTEEASQALCDEHKMQKLRQVTIAPLNGHYHHTGSVTLEVYQHLMQAQWWSQIEALACCTGGSYGRSSDQRTLYPLLARHADRLGALRHLVMEDTRSVESLLETPLLLQLTRLSLSLCEEEATKTVMDYLADPPDPHQIQTLDLSRGAFVGIYGRPKKYAKPPQKAAVERLLQRENWGELREVIINPDYLGVRLQKRLKAWGGQAQVTLTTCAW